MASTRRSRRRCCSRPGTTWSAQPSSSGAESPTPAAARWPTWTTPAAVARRLGIEHHTFSFGDDFDEHVVEPYLADHAAGRTPNPCIECNRHLKFDRLLRRADALGFQAVATGHHARVVEGTDGTRRVARGADPAKDQSYVVHMLDPATLARVRFPVGHLTKVVVRAEAARLGLATAAKPDSQDVCFITATGGREAFLGPRLATHPGTVVDRTGERVGHVGAVELVTIGQRHGLGLAGGTEPRYVVDVDVPSATVTVGDRGDLLTGHVELVELAWTGQPVGGTLLAQTSAHGSPRACTADGDVVRFVEPTRRVAPGQSVVLYDRDEVVASGIAR